MTYEIIDKWKVSNNISNYEGSRGLFNFEELLKTIGYHDDSIDRSIINFLVDNSGAIEALEEWISLLNNKEWEEDIIADTVYDPEDDDEDDEEEEENEDNEDDDTPYCNHGGVEKVNK